MGRLKQVGFTGMLCLLLSSHLWAGEPAKDSRRNLSYQSVLAQTYQAPVAKLHYGDAPLQYGLLWLPATDSNTQKFPLVIFIHGGCWLSAYDISHSRPLTSALANQGYAVWSIEYRRTGDEGGGWPGSFDDILSAIGFVSMMQEYPVDLANVSMVGHSAGGHLALLAASHSLPINIRQVIGLAAITDIKTYAEGDNSCQKATPVFMGGTPSELVEQYRQASPFGKPLNDFTVLLHGSLDGIVPLSQSFLPGAKHLRLEGAGHFDWIHPKSDAFDMLLDVLKNAGEG